jgi:hypothetical protein
MMGTTGLIKLVLKEGFSMKPFAAESITTSAQRLDSKNLHFDMMLWSRLRMIFLFFLQGTW